MTARETVKIVAPSCRTVDEGRRVQAELEKHGLRRGEDASGVYVMCQIPSNMLLAGEFAEVFDGSQSTRTTLRSSSLAWTATARSSSPFSTSGTPQ